MSRRDLTTGRYLPGPRCSDIPAVCAVCSAPFMTRQAVVRAGYGKYCGQDCAGLARRRREIRRCVICTEPFEVRPGIARAATRVTCGAACQYENRRRYLTASISERIWRRVDKTDSCWLWTGSTDRKGYGQMTAKTVSSSPIRLHKFAWVEASGTPIPDGLEVCHTCDVPRCIRNDEQGIYVVRGVALPRFGHLFLGTHAQNLADMADKGRKRKRHPTTNSTV